ncbi:MAG: hypothetical protein Q4G10_01210 [Bacteroidia bacterium]|nr:hypothetical protein [Bacteroidia bacterium]
MKKFLAAVFVLVALLFIGCNKDKPEKTDYRVECEKCQGSFLVTVSQRGLVAGSGGSRPAYDSIPMTVIHDPEMEELLRGLQDSPETKADEVDADGFDSYAEGSVVTPDNLVLNVHYVKKGMVPYCGTNIIVNIRRPHSAGFVRHAAKSFVWLFLT